MTQPKPFELSPALAGSVALIVAGFGAIGLSGDFLLRAVRNNPILVAIAVSAGLIAIGSIVAFSVTRLYVQLVVAVLVASVVFGIVVGALSIRDRDQPGLSISATSTVSTTTISLDVSGSGLATSDSLLVQVVGLKTKPPMTADSEMCETSRIEATPKTDRGDLLMWGRSGPDTANGDVKRTITLEIPAKKYPIVCAWAALPERNENKLDDDRRVPAYLLLSPS